jgi:four helix bundle protein
MDRDLNDRLFNFAVKVIKYCREMNRAKDHDVIQYQLIKASTSSGANYEEAQSASSKPDFKHKIDISLREMRESNYWLKIIKAIDGIDDRLSYLIDESEELKKILGSISSKISKGQK